MTLARITAALALLAFAHTTRSQETERPLDPQLTEQVETRIVQIDVSVVDRKAKTRASVPGLTKDMFRLRVNHRRLDDEAYARVGFDEVCGETGPAGLDASTLLVMADFNYLDGQMRWNTAQALRGLADAGIPEGTRVKVIGYTRFLFEIQGFTDDPEKLREAAALIATAAGLGGPGSAPDLIPTTGAPGRTAPAAPSAPAAASLPVAELPTGTADAPSPAPGAPPGGYLPGELVDPLAPELDSSSGSALEQPTEDVLLRLSDKTNLLAGLPSIEFGPSVSADPFLPRAGPNPGTVLPESYRDPMAVPEPGATLAEVQAYAATVAAMLEENTGRGRVDRLGFYDHRASLAAIEAVLRGHASLRGRKALIVFTAEEFSTPHEEDMERDVEAVLDAAQEGYSLWLVDSRGFYDVLEDDVRSESDLLTKLAKDTGGEPFRDAGDLADVFARVEESLDCYYLFSIPVPRSEGPETLSVTVSLDTSRYRELFPYTVVHQQRVNIHDRARELELERTAALMNPADWERLPLRADLAFPQEDSRRLRYLPAEVSIPLGELTFEPEPDGGVSAEFLIDLAIDRNGREPICLMPAKGDAVIRKVLLPHALPPDFRGNLVIRSLCPYRGRGLYTLRAVLTEPTTEVPSGTLRHYRIDARPGASLTVDALRAGHNTGQDYYLVEDGSERTRVSRDRQREAFVRLEESEAAVTGDRVMFRYVVCGPSRDDAVHRIRRLVYRRTGDGVEPLFLLPGSEDGEEHADTRSPFCVEVQDAIPPELLPAGSYGFAVLDLGMGPLSVADLGAALLEGDGSGLLAHIDFEIDGPAGPSLRAGPATGS